MSTEKNVCLFMELSYDRIINERKVNVLGFLASCRLVSVVVNLKRKRSRMIMQKNLMTFHADIILQRKKCVNFHAYNELPVIILCSKKVTV